MKIFFKEDIRAALVATALAGAVSDREEAWCKGLFAGLALVAVALKEPQLGKILADIAEGNIGNDTITQLSRSWSKVLDDQARGNTG